MRKNFGGKPFQEILENGAVEYVDVWEQEHILLAYSINLIRHKEDETKELLDEKENLINELQLVSKGEDIFSDNTLLNRKKELEKELEDLKHNHKVLSEEKVKLIAERYDDIDRRTDRVRRINMIKQDLLELDKNVRRMKEKLRLWENKDKELKAKIESSLDDLTQNYNREIEKIDNLIVKKSVRKFYTHCELTPDAIMGFSASIAPLANSQPGPRTTYQSSMGRQALGIYHSRYMERFDTSSKVLLFPTRPLFETHINSMIGLDELPAGEEVVMAVMPYLGYNQEDGIILNKGAVDRGLFTGINFHIFNSEISNSPDFIEKFEAPVNVSAENKEKFELVGKDGIPEVGKFIKQGQVIVNKVRIYSNGKKENVPTGIGLMHEGVVSRILRGKTIDGQDIVKVKIEQRYIPGQGSKGTGDKFALRYSQKGTVTKILPEEEMPYVEGTSIRPDVILIHTGFPAERLLVC